MWLRAIVGFRLTIVIAVPSYAFVERHFMRMMAAKKPSRSIRSPTRTVAGFPEFVAIKQALKSVSRPWFG
ncbi:MAG TPA: hypothetical protein VNZ48_18595 [Xanthobacteraceae bacterium]|jgi:peptidoglycan/LPS O-acetylase OafA/YrhL|nr:hypothetical protein [Xanthobacteraceae bacterium]